MFQEKRVGIVVVHWRNIKDTLECLDSINKINYHNYKVILVNNDTENFPLGPSEMIEIINNGENLGFIKACNQGLKKAIEQKADYILSLNNDTVVDKNFLKALVAFCEENPKTIVSPVIYTYQSDKVENMGGRLIYWLGICQLIREEQLMPPDYLSGACFLAKAVYFSDIGYLDESYIFYFDDLDWSIRARAKGYLLRIVHESRIWHKHSASTRVKNGWGPEKAYYIARNTFTFGDKHFKGIKKWWWFLGYTLIGVNLQFLFFCRNSGSFKKQILGIRNGLSYVLRRGY